jgi:energy-coupling factor transporter ATP-binding protein EcfA2
VSFSLHRGEVLGLVGRNGAGKSTLLQIVCGTLMPSSGTLNVRGRVAALLELGAGFNVEFSGRDNVYLYGSVLGLSHQEMADRFDEMFAGGVAKPDAIKQASIALGDDASQAYAARAMGKNVEGKGRALIEGRRAAEAGIGDTIEGLGLPEGYQAAKTSFQAARLAREAADTSLGRADKRNFLSLTDAPLVAAGGGQHARADQGPGGQAALPGVCRRPKARRTRSRTRSTSHRPTSAGGPAGGAAAATLARCTWHVGRAAPAGPAVSERPGRIHRWRA